MPIPASDKAHSFPASRRLRQKSEFDAVYRYGRRFSDVHFLVLARPNDCGYPRLGMSVSVRAIGDAVNRNRVKRTVRESFRHHQAELPHWDIVVSARSGAREATNAALVASLETQWQQVVRACAQH